MTKGILLLLLAGVAWADALDKIKDYEGSWKTDTENFDSPYGKAGKESSTLKNRCWRSSGYFVCDQIVNGESKALLVFTYDAKEDVYHSYPIPTDGSAAGAGTLRIKGNVWTYPWEGKDHDETVYFQVVNTFTSPGTIEYRREFSRDKEHWTVIAKGIEKKQ